MTALPLNQLVENAEPLLTDIVPIQRGTENLGYSSLESIQTLLETVATAQLATETAAQAALINNIAQAAGSLASGAAASASLALAQTSAIIATAITAGAVIYSTRTALYADLLHGAGTVGVVYDDSTPSYNGFYAKSGSSGSGSWAITPLYTAPNFNFDGVFTQPASGGEYVDVTTDSYGRISEATTATGAKFIPKLIIPWQGSRQTLSSVLAAIDTLAASPAKQALLANLANGGWPSIMVTAPTMTMGAPNGSTQISGSSLDPWNSAKGRDLFGTTAQFGGNPYKLWTSAFYGGSLYLANGAAREFQHTGTKFEIMLRGNGENIRLLVNGQLASATPVTLPADGNAYLWLIDFTAISGSPVSRLIRIEGSGNLEFGGVTIKSGESIAAPSNTTPPVVGLIGDSFIESGTGVNYPCGGMSFALARMFGWNMFSSGVGSTGLLNPGGLNTSSQQKVNFQNRVTDLTGIANLALGMVMLSINDNINSNTYGGGAPTPTMSTIQASAYAGMAEFITEFQSGAPGIPLIVLGPTWPNPTPTQSMYLYRDGCREACGAYGGVHYIDQYLDNLLTGTGDIGSQTGTGNSDFYVYSDGTHPSQAGHEYRGLVLAAKIKALIEEAF